MEIKLIKIAKRLNKIAFVVLSNEREIFSKIIFDIDRYFCRKVFHSKACKISRIFSVKKYI